MLYGWMKSLIIYIVLSGVVVNMTPGKNYKRYINAFMGLIILIILSEPLSYIFHLSSGDISGIVTELSRYSDTDSYGGSDDGLYNYYELSLSESVRLDLLEKGLNVQSVSVITAYDGSILRLTVYMPADYDGTQDEADLKNYISEVYNADVTNIYIVRR